MWLVDFVTLCLVLIKFVGVPPSPLYGEGVGGGLNRSGRNLYQSAQTPAFTQSPSRSEGRG